MNRVLLYLILLTINVLIISAGDFETYMDSIDIYNNRYDSLLVNSFPASTASVMEEYLKGNDYIKHFIAYRVLSLYSNRDSIAHVMYANGVELRHILNIAVSLKDDSILNDAAITGSAYERTVYSGLLLRRNDRKDLHIITSMLNDTSLSIRLGALNYLNNVDYIYMLNDSVKQYLEEYRNDANFREYILIESIFHRIDNVSNTGHEYKDNDSINTNGVNNE